MVATADRVSLDMEAVWDCSDCMKVVAWVFSLRKYCGFNGMVSSLATGEALGPRRFTLKTYMM